MPDVPASAPSAPPSSTAPASSPGSGSVSIRPEPPSEVKPPPVEKAAASTSFYDEIDKIAAAPDPKKKSPPKKEGKESPPTRKAASKSTESTTAGDTSPGESPADTADSPSASTESSSDATKPGESERSSSEKAPFKAPELRAAYERTKSELKTLRAELEKARSAKPSEDPDKPKLLEGLTAAQNRIRELEEEVKFSAYERSEEYKERFEKPWVSAFQAGYHRATQLVVNNSDGTTRPGTPDDFKAIMSIHNDAQAAKVAVEMFGDQAPLVMYDRARVQEKMREREEALEANRHASAEREKLRTAEQMAKRERAQQQFARMGEDFKRMTSEAVEKYPQYFKAEEGDTEGERLLQKGFELMEKAFSGPNGLPAEQRVAVHAAMHNKAAAFDYVVYKARKEKAALTERVSELEKELEQFKSSEPGPDGGGHKKPAAFKTFEEEIDALAR